MGGSYQIKVRPNSFFLFLLLLLFFFLLVSLLFRLISSPSPYPSSLGRVINILRNWLNKHYYDFKNVDLTKQLLDFVDRVISVNNKKWADQLHLILQEQVDSIVKGVLSRDSALPVIKAAMKKHEAGLLMRYKKDPSKRVFSGLSSSSPLLLLLLLLLNQLLTSPSLILTFFSFLFSLLFLFFSPAARAITWLVTNLSLIHRIEGVAIGNRMIQAGLLCHVSKPKATFIDNEEEYYFFIRVSPLCPFLLLFLFSRFFFSSHPLLLHFVFYSKRMNQKRRFTPSP